MNNKYNLLHSFNGIPYDEEVVPFPNFGAVIFQHNRELADKISIENNSVSWSFSDINNLILKFQTYFDEIGVKEKDVIGLSLGNNPIEILLLFALLFKGAIVQPIFPIYTEKEIDKLFNKSKAKIIFDLDSKLKINHKNSKKIKVTNTKKFLSKIEKYNEKENTLPFVHLKHSALRIFKKEIGIMEFNQYNLLTAAQSIGKTFHLFRPGISILNHKIQDLTDFIYSIFAPFYYGKTIFIDEKMSNETIVEKVNDGEVHYSYFGINYSVNELQKIDYDFKNTLRDATIVANIRKQKINFKLSKKIPITKIYGDDFSCGVGLVFDENGNHKCMDNIEIVKIDKDGKPVLENQNGEFAFRGHTIFDKLITKRNNGCNFIRNDWFVTEIDVKNI